MSGKLPTRSTQGCWTCRLRKKKCDENHPSCFRCTSLRIACDGYGPRPCWMDRGDLQRKQAQYKTYLIAQSKSATREGSIPPPGPLHTDVPRDELNSLATDMNLGAMDVSKSNHDHHPRKTHAPRRGLELSLNGRDADADLHTSVDTDFSTDHFNYEAARTISPYSLDISHFSSSTEVSDLTAQCISRDTEECSFGGSISMPSLHSPSSEATTMGAIDFLYGSMLGVGEYYASDISGHSSRTYTPSHDKATRGQSTRSSSSSDLAPQQTVVPSPAANPISSSNGSNHMLHGEFGGAEDILFMHYLDQVFFVHCPFYLPSNRRGRGWLLSILKRVKSAYHAALALSEYYYHLGRDSASTQNGGGYYNLALWELQSTSGVNCLAWHGNFGLVHSLELLTTILHLLFYQSCRGDKHGWQMHIASANALLPSLVRAQMGMKHTAQDHAQAPGRGPAAAATATADASRFLLGFFIHVHLVTCATTRSCQFLLPDHMALLETGDVNLEDLVGCSNWAMVFMGEISTLDRWKREQEDIHRLSLIELTRRGRQIEERLMGRLAGMDNKMKDKDSLMKASAADDSSDTNLRRPDRLKAEITRIFALSAVTYLHVVLSGAHPEIPEIKRSVPKTLNALRALSDPGLLRNVAWPYCISGCLAADDEQQKAFRELVSLQRRHKTHGACVEALNIMEECWRLRRAGSASHDWTSVMERRGQFVLLI